MRLAPFYLIPFLKKRRTLITGNRKAKDKRLRRRYTVHGERLKGWPRLNTIGVCFADFNWAGKPGSYNA